MSENRLKITFLEGDGLVSANLNIEGDVPRQ